MGGCVLVAVLVALVGITTAEEDPGKACTQAWVSCLQPLADTYAHVTPDQIITLVQSTPVDVFCGQLAKTARCVDLVLLSPDCADHLPQEDADLYLSTFTYLCDPHGSQMLQQMKQSACLKDREILYSLGGHVWFCDKAGSDLIEPYLEVADHDVSRLDPHDVCPILQQTFSCIITSTEKRCGQVFGQFVAGLLDIVGVENMIARPASFCAGQLKIARAVSRRGLSLLGAIWT